MNYSKIIILGSLFIGKVAISIEPKEFLAQWKAMAEQERQAEIARLEVEHKQLEEEDIQFAKKASQNENPNLERKNSIIARLREWKSDLKIGHIEVFYFDSQGQRCKNRLQLVDSKKEEEFFWHNSEKVQENIEKLSMILPQNKKPKVVVYRDGSQKFSLYMIGLSNPPVPLGFEKDNLYAATVDYTDEKL